MKIMTARKSLGSFLVMSLIFSISHVHAQQIQRPIPQIEAVLTETAPKVEGKLDAACWKKIVYQSGGQEVEVQSAQLRIEPLAYNRSDTYSREKECRYQVVVGPQPEPTMSVRIKAYPSGGKTAFFTKELKLDSAASATFTIPIGNLELGRYAIEATLVDKDGNELGMARREFSKTKSVRGEVTIREDKTILVDGDPFFPFGFYAAGNFGVLEMMSRNGFNAGLYAGGVRTHPAAMKRYLGAYHALDLKAMPEAQDRDMYKTKEISSEAEKFMRGRIPELGDNPGMIAWYIADEPDGQGIPFSTIQRLANIVHESDVNHPTILVTLASGCDPYAKASDIHMNDPYYPMWRPNVAMVRAYMDAGINSAGGKKPYIATLLGAYHASKGRDIRCQTYLAVVRGAKGVMFFSMQYVLNHEKLWEEFRHVGMEIDDFSPVIFAPQAPEQVKVSSDLIDPDILLKKYKGKYYLITVNYQAADLPATFDLSGLSVKQEIEVLYEDRSITMKDSRFTDKFAGHDVHVYCLSPDGAVAGKATHAEPKIVGLRPRPGETVSLAAPMIKAAFLEEEGGPDIDAKSVTVKVDGEVVHPEDGLVLNMKGVKKGIYYLPNKDLPRGPHTVVVEAKDLLGRTASRSWSFTTTHYPMPFIDRFDKPNEGWSPLGGKWKLEDGSYIVDAADNDAALSFVQDINLRGDYTLEFSAKVDSFNENSQILLWMNEEIHPIVDGSFFPALFRIWFTRERGFLSRMTSQPHAQGAILLQPGKWHKFKVLRKDRTINGYVDGETVFTYYVPWSGNGGGFALGARNARVAFGDVEVKRLANY